MTASYTSSSSALTEGQKVTSGADVIFGRRGLPASCEGYRLIVIDSMSGNCSAHITPGAQMTFDDAVEFIHSTQSQTFLSKQKLLGNSTFTTFAK